MSNLNRCDITTSEKFSFLILLYKISFVRCILKWIVRFFTGTCEIQRIMKNYSGGIRTLKLGKY